MGCSDQFGRAIDGLQEYYEMTAHFQGVGLSGDLVKGSEQTSVREEYVEDAPWGVTRQTLDHVFVSQFVMHGTQGQPTSARIVDTRGKHGRVVSDHRGIALDLHLT